MESQEHSHQQEEQLSILADDELSEEELAHISSGWPAANAYYLIYSEAGQTTKFNPFNRSESA